MTVSSRVLQGTKLLRKHGRGWVMAVVAESFSACDNQQTQDTTTMETTDSTTTMQAPDPTTTVTTTTTTTYTPAEGDINYRC